MSDELMQNQNENTEDISYHKTPEEVISAGKTITNARWRVWAGWSAVGVITVGVILGVSYWLYDIKGSTTRTGEVSISKNTPNAKDIDCSKIDTDGALSDGEVRVSNTSQLEKCLVNKSNQDSWFQGDAFDYKVFGFDTDDATGKVTDTSSAIFDTEGDSVSTSPGLFVAYPDFRDGALEKSDVRARTNNDSMICTSYGCGTTDKTTYNDFIGTGIYASAKAVSESGKTVDVSENVKIFERNLTYRANSDSKIYHIDFFDIYAKASDGYYYKTQFVFHNISDVFYKKDAVNFSKLVQLYAENIKS